ncbi:alpha/beta fold hydrolase [Tenacibaculum caenipelagi]|uniref:Pimeloyl-ACP methyl ester carboxylesterase n=1 Tax=Tenacibaculum caenipelagi TaxID=1325435 RepID=A0A4R6THG7_9FLAO|nr:alpha/beta hydrolase [Tenacibaculum caenipelagi]TDQ28616.1 pimeloyl-ACP methyl ester carboxylesterase [Tenacibaculum caenipelagi]
MQKVYFISGTMCTVDLWQFVFPKLENIQPIHIDITLANSFDEINDIILNHIEEPATIVGFSLGGFSAMNFAIHHPEKVKRLIIVAANTNGLSDSEIQLRKSTIDFLEKHSYKGISHARVQQFLHLDNHNNTTIVSIIKKMDVDLGKKVLIRQLKATSTRINISEEVLKLNIPILFIVAENDALVKATEVKEFANQTLKGRQITIKNCGHMIPLEKHKELSSILNLTIN